jgi:hypothetical protein
MFSVKRNKKDEIILDLQFNLFPLLLKFFSTLDVVFSSKAFYSIPMGLGLGFGFAIIVFSNPSGTIANSKLNLLDNPIIIPTQITLENINFTSSIKNQTAYSLIPLKWKNSTINFVNFPRKLDTQTIIGSKDNFVNQINLGEKIIIEGKNNGVYRYSVYEIKELQSKDINNLMSNNQAKVIILNPSNSLGTKYLAALAK